MMINRRAQLWLFIIFSIAIISCQKEKYITSGDFKLQFSTDTVSFDTIFSSIGSTTEWLKVKNPSKYSVSISKIYLAGGADSPFRLNINGVDGVEDKDVKISSGDSIFIFVEVTIDPTGQNNPMIVKDSIVFELNGNIQDVKLVAFGQDFHLFKGDVLATQRWQNDKPYLIYNSVWVDTLKTLSIDPGCRIYFHKGSSFVCKRDSKRAWYAGRAREILRRSVGK